MELKYPQKSQLKFKFLVFLVFERQYRNIKIKKHSYPIPLFETYQLKLFSHLAAKTIQKKINKLKPITLVD
jgi:hypothetical protein